MPPLLFCNFYEIKANTRIRKVRHFGYQQSLVKRTVTIAIFVAFAQFLEFRPWVLSYLDPYLA